MLLKRLQKTRNDYTGVLFLHFCMRSYTFPS